MSWILGSLVILYFLLGLLVNLIVPHLSPKLEISLGDFFKKQILTSENHKRNGEMMEILEGFLPLLSAEDRRFDYRVYVDESDVVNAVALPGGNIVVFSGLLDKIESTHEIAFVLAHELGHYHNRDHLKVMGRSLLMVILSIALSGHGSSATNFFLNSINFMQIRYSRGQEKKADLFALDLLMRRYGHAEGAVKFMEKLVVKNKTWKLLYYFATHPHPQTRLKYIKNQIKKEKEGSHATNP